MLATPRAGGATFHFLTDGVEAAYELAVDAAGDRPIRIASSASCAREAVRAGIVDEIDVPVNPSFWGRGIGYSMASPRVPLASSLSASARRPVRPTCGTASCGDDAGVSA
jgi:hypothetical protein